MREWEWPIVVQLTVDGQELRWFVSTCIKRTWITFAFTFASLDGPDSWNRSCAAERARNFHVFCKDVEGEISRRVPSVLWTFRSCCVRGGYWVGPGVASQRRLVGAVSESPEEGEGLLMTFACLRLGANIDCFGTLATHSQVSCRASLRAISSSMMTTACCILTRC